MRIILSCLLLLPQVSHASSEELQIGVAEQLANMSNDEIAHSIEKTCEAGMKLIRFDAHWSAAETTKGQYTIPAKWDFIVDKAKAADISPILILDYGNKFYDNGDKPTSEEAQQAFAEYAKFVANHFKNRVKYFEIWNEWNGKAGNTTPGNGKDYASLTKYTYPAIKSSAPNSLVIVASFSAGTFDKFFNRGKGDQLKEFLDSSSTAYGDIIALHPYTVYWEPKFRNFETYLAQIKQGLNLIRATPAYSQKPVFITESGWSTSKSEYGTSERLQARWLKKAISSSKKLGISAFIVYELRDGSKNSDDTESNFGLLHNDWTPKPAYGAIASQPISCKNQ
jgi:beta-glucosidase/6-phospho-beta-glucosidase/beta-galactosidase